MTMLVSVEFCKHMPQAWCKFGQDGEEAIYVRKICALFVVDSNGMVLVMAFKLKYEAIEADLSGLLELNFAILICWPAVLPFKPWGPV
ncbi:hypothetical protein Prudu_021380 [Prunus dulcis]|uniref:Uncharacterized protein n=1 Tax=Prunus dulcis TaxID=3755 RepID=A0A4Y1RX97_PRUDU|nr:hypothetical protein Prudu_021380 [Prunus dulcis]